MKSVKKEPCNHVRFLKSLFTRGWMVLAAFVLTGAIGGCAWFSFSSAAVAGSDPGAEVAPNALESDYFAARLALAVGEPAHAIERLERCLKQSDCPPQVYTALAGIQISQLQIDKAQATLDRGLKAYPEDARLWHLQSKIQRHQGKTEQAIASLKRALAGQPHAQRLLEDLSDLYLQKLRQGVTTEKDLVRQVGDLIDVYEKMLAGREGSDRLPPLLVLSSLYLRSDQPERAAAAASEAIGINAHEVRCYQALGAAEEALKKPDEALKAYKDGLLLDSDNKEIHAKIEQLLDASQGTDKKARFYADLAQSFPKDKQIQELYTRTLLQQKRWGEAETHLRRVLATWPDDPQAQVARVRVWVGLGRAEDAIAETRRLGAKNKELAPLATLSLADALLGRGDKARAERVLADGHKADAANENVMLALASLLLEERKDAEAVRMLEDFHQRRPDLFTATALLTQGYVSQKRYADAEKLLAGVSEASRKQNSEDLLHLQAEVYRRQKNWKPAIEALQALLKAHADVAQYYLDLGTLYQDMGRNGEAEQYLREAFKLDPDDAETNNTLGYFYADTNQKLDQALELINRAIKLKPDAGHIMDSLGWVLYRRGEYKLAVEKLDAAVRMMQPPDPVVFEHLGDAYDKLGQTRRAREAWTKALALDGESASVKKKLATGAGGK